jgi:hypothetical protein
MRSRVIKLAIPRQCELNLLGQLRRTGSYYEQAIGGFPMIKPLALFRQCKHVSARITDGADLQCVRKAPVNVKNMIVRRSDTLRADFSRSLRCAASVHRNTQRC